MMEPEDRLEAKEPIDMDARLAQTFSAAVMMCYNNPDFMREYRRLSGSRFGLQGSPLEQMVDEALGFPGFTDEQAIAFFEFVREFVWERWLAGLVYDQISLRKIVDEHAKGDKIEPS